MNTLWIRNSRCRHFNKLFWPPVCKSKILGWCQTTIALGSVLKSSLTPKNHEINTFDALIKSAPLFSFISFLSLLESRHVSVVCLYVGPAFLSLALPARVETVFVGPAVLGRVGKSVQHATLGSFLKTGKMIVVLQLICLRVWVKERAHPHRTIV